MNESDDSLEATDDSLKQDLSLSKPLDMQNNDGRRGYEQGNLNTLTKIVYEPLIAQHDPNPAPPTKSPFSKRILPGMIERSNPFHSRIQTGLTKVFLLNRI